MVTLYKIMSQSQSAFHTNRSSVLTQSQNDRMQTKQKQKQNTTMV